MFTAAIIGAGEVGGAVAQALAGRDRFGRVLLVDAAARAAAGKALDIMQSGAVDGFHTRLDGTDDLTRVIGCNVIIVSDRFAAGSAEWQGEDALAMVSRLVGLDATAPLVFAGTSQAALLSMCANEVGIPRARLIGSATEAFASAVRSIVAMEARCSPRDVMLTVLGAPPDRLVVPWSDASIGGYALERTLDQVQLNRIQARLPRLWPPGPYALGVAAARVAEAIVSGARSHFSVMTVLAGEFGVSGRVGILPAMLAGVGIVHTRTPELNVRERVLLGTALG